MDFAQAQVTKAGNNFHVSHGNDAQLFPEFYDREVLDQAASEREGRPIHKTVPYCKIIFPGDRTKMIDEPVVLEQTEGGKTPHSRRFPKQWNDYKNQREQVAEGTSLLEWPPLPRAEAMDFKAMKIHTVEQLASIQDQNLTWLGARAWRDKAKSWLEQASGGQAVIQLQGENARLRADLEMMREQIKDLAAMKVPEEKAAKHKHKTEGE